MQLENFANWLTKETQDHGWTFGELSRRAQLSPTSISEVINQKTNPGLRFCTNIARAFRLPPEQVLRRAGLLPTLPPPVQQEEESLSIIRNLPNTTRTLALNILRTLAATPGTAASPLQGEPQLGTIAEPTPPPYTPNPLETQLLTTFHQLTPDFQEQAIADLESMAQFQIRIIGEEPENEPQRKQKTGSK